MTEYKPAPEPPKFLLYNEEKHGAGFAYGVCAHHADGSPLMELHGPFKEHYQAANHLFALRNKYDDYGSLYVVRIELVAP